MTYHVPEHVIRNAQLGNPDAQAQIIDTFRKPLTYTANKFLWFRFRDDVDDCVNDIFVKVLAHLQDFDFSRNIKFSTWIYTFARNQCFDKLKKKRLKTFSLQRMSYGDDDESTYELPGPDDSPVELVGRREFRTALGQALELLPAMSRRIFHLHAVHGLEFRQIARQQQMPLGTIKSKYYRACERLKRRLQPFQIAV